MCNNRMAIVAITKNGVQLSRKLHKQLPNSELFYPSKFQLGDEAESSITLYDYRLKQLLEEIFPNYRGIVLFVALGAVVRLIAPLITDKKNDPAVVVVDEQATFAISVLSGHLGGANELTEEVASILQAQPVITTASDVQQTLQVDLFGRSYGWVIEPFEYVKAVSVEVVNNEKVAIVQESGEKVLEKAYPANIQFFPSIEQAIESAPKALLVITHRLINVAEDVKTIFYRPKVICLGIGCNRGTTMEEIETVICETLDQLRLSIKSVKAICSIDLKKDEVGLLAVAEKYNWETHFYKAEELNQMTISDPSETVFKYTGAYGVSEPAALLYSGASSLELVKKKSGNVTISVAIIKE